MLKYTPCLVSISLHFSFFPVMLKGENGDALVPSPTSDNGRSKSIEGHLPLVPLSEEKGAAMQSILLEVCAHPLAALIKKALCATHSTHGPQLEETKKKLDKSNKDLERLRTHLIESEDNHNLQLIEQQKKMDQLTKRSFPSPPPPLSCV